MDPVLARATFRTLFFALDGRITPRAWRLGMLAVFVVFLLVDAGLRTLAGTSGTASRLIRFTVFIAFLYPFVALCAKRLADRGRSGEWALLVALPSALHAAFSTGGVLLPGSVAGTTLGSLLGIVIVAGFSWFLLELGYLPGKANPPALRRSARADARERQLTHGARLP